MLLGAIDVSQEWSVIMLMSLDDIDVCVACKNKNASPWAGPALYICSLLSI